MVGQPKLVHRMLIGLLANGHILIEGVPGLAKTTAVASLAKAIDTGFQRLQFTPDLLPADLIGTLVYRPQDQEFVVQKGPIFSNLILADEINRAPAKVQSALLEAMQERQVTIGGETYPLDEPFLVMATQNPVEQEGTYQLPEAQTDRFMLKVVVEYPNRTEELEILRRMSKTKATFDVQPVTTPQEIMAARSLVDQIYVSEKIRKLRRRSGDGHANSGSLRIAAGRHDSVRRFTTSHNQSDSGGESKRLPARPRLRNSTRRQRNRNGRPATPSHGHIRSGSRGTHERIDRHGDSRRCEGTVNRVFSVQFSVFSKGALKAGHAATTLH